MSAILNIAKRDLMSFFYSLKGSIVFWVFLIFIGFFFHSFVVAFMDMQAQAMGYGGEGPTLNQLLTAIFHNLHFILLLIVPAVTMASFAEEKKNHVDRLLQTSPVTTLQIVIGKFFAKHWSLNSNTTRLFSFPLYTVIYGNADIGTIASAYLGHFFSYAPKVAMRNLVSSMTNVSSLLSYLIFELFLLILNWIAPNITSSGGAEFFVKYLASTSHLDNFFKGLISVART